MALSKTLSALVARGLKGVEWLPAAAVAIYMAVLASRFRGLVRALYWNSDIAFLPAVAESLPSTPGPLHVIVGPNNSSTTLWFDLLTRPLPGHRLIWQVAPAVLTLCGLLLLAWAAWRVAGRWAAMLTFAIGAAAAPSVLTSVIAQSVHVTTWFTGMMLAAFLVFVIRAKLSRSIVAAALAVALVAGTNLVSDPLLLMSGIVPFIAAPLVLLLRRRDRATLFVASVATATGAAALLIAGISYFAIRQAGFSITSVFLGTTGKADFATAPAAKGNVKAFFSNVFSMANGEPVRPPFTLGRVVAFVCAGLAIAALVWIVCAALRSVWRGGAPGHERGGAATLYLLFWAITVLAVGSAFVLSNVAVGTDTGRYLVPIFYAVAASAPVLASRSAALRVGVAAATVIFCLLSASALAGDSIARATKQIPMVSHQRAITAILERERVVRGYAAYWTANAFAWKSGGKLRISPVFECGAPPTRALCRFPANRVDGWYVPRPNIASFLFVDPAAPPPALALPPPVELGPPQATYQFGPISVFVYPYDIAERIRLP